MGTWELHCNCTWGALVKTVKTVKLSKRNWQLACTTVQVNCCHGFLGCTLYVTSAVGTCDTCTTIMCRFGFCAVYSVPYIMFNILFCSLSSSLEMESIVTVSLSLTGILFALPSIFFCSTSSSPNTVDHVYCCREILHCYCLK